MGHFDGSVDHSIKKDSAGRSVYFPWTYLGKGRVLDNPEVGTKLRRFVAAYNVIWGLIVIGAVLFTEGRAQAGFLLVSFPVMFCVFYFGTRNILAGCPESEEKLSFSEFQAAQAKNANEVLLLLATFLCICFVGLSLWAFLSVKGLPEKAVGVLGMGFFGLGAAKLIYVLKLKSGIK